MDVRRYAEQTLQPLPSSQVQQLGEGSERRLVDGPDGRREYLWQRLALPEEDWTLHLLHDPQSVSASVRSYRLAAAGVWMTLAFLATRFSFRFRGGKSGGARNAFFPCRRGKWEDAR